MVPFLQVVRMDIELFAVSKELGTNQKSLGQEQKSAP